MTKKLPESEKQQRKPASRACVHCHYKHLQCSNERPCQNCIKRGRASECRNVERKKGKYMKLASRLFPQSESPAGGVQLSPSPDISLHMSPIQGITSRSDSSTGPSSGLTTLQFDFPGHAPSEKLVLSKKPEVNVVSRFPSGAMLNTTDDVLHRLFGNDGNIQARTPDFSSQPIDESVPLSIQLLFSSSYLSQEYNVLGDIVLKSKPTSPSPSNSSILDAVNIDQSNDHLSFTSSAFPPASALSHSSSLGPAQLSHTTTQLMPLISQGLTTDRGSRSHRKQTERIKQSRPFISLGTVADSPEEHTSPAYTQNMHLAVREIYSGASVSFDYPESYHLLTKFLKTRFLGHGLSPELRQQKRQSLIQILKLIASYRPTFISAHKLLLKPTDLQFLEMCLQRSLLDYQRLCYLNSSPTIIWRRTGEIVSITSDLLSILGYEMKDLIENRTFIVELMHDDESIINYYRLFKSVAVGNLHLTIFTQCKLSKKPDWSGVQDKDHIDFCSVWTVKRDLYDLPMLIIGLFLPVLHA